MKTEMSVYWFFYHIIQIALFQFYAAPRLSFLSLRLLEKRNPKIAQEILGQRFQLHPAKWDYGIGVIALLLLIYGLLDQNKVIYWAGKYFSLIGFLTTLLLIDSLLYFKFKKQIPLLGKRSAQLTPRTLGRIVPIWNWLLYIVICGWWVLNQESLKQKIFTAITPLIMLVVAFFIEKRAKLLVKNEDDELYRKSEAWSVASIAWAVPLLSFFETQLGRTAMDAAFSTLPLVYFLIFINSSVYRKMIS